MDFGKALDAIKAGSSVQRAGWNGKGMFVCLQPPGEMTVPYIFITNAEGDRVPWVTSQADVLAEDWQIV
jgi:Protein of unknown function (DUF2829)